MTDAPTPAPSTSDPDDDPIVLPTDVRMAGHCATGTREWLAFYKIPLLDFFQGKVHASQFIATGDANGLRVVAETQARVAKAKAKN